MVVGSRATQARRAHPWVVRARWSAPSPHGERAPAGPLAPLRRVRSRPISAPQRRSSHLAPPLRAATTASSSVASSSCCASSPQRPLPKPRRAPRRAPLEAFASPRSEHRADRGRVGTGSPRVRARPPATAPRAARAATRTPRRELLHDVFARSVPPPSSPPASHKKTPVPPPPLSLGTPFQSPVTADKATAWHLEIWRSVRCVAAR